MYIELTWYCGLYQCFRSQSHKIIWKTQERHISYQSCIVIIFVCVHNREYEMHLHRKFDLCSSFRTIPHDFSVRGTSRSVTEWQNFLLVDSACSLNTWCSNSLHWEFPAPHDALSTTGMRMHAALATADRGLSLKAKEEKQTTKTTMVRRQWNCEILSGSNYVNQLHFPAICW